MTQTPTSANDILMGGGGAPGFKFDQPGASIAGRIVAISQPYQEREYDPTNPGGGAPKFFPKSGDPIMTFNVDVETTLRDPSIEDDDGVRRVYMDGKRIKDAVRTGVRAAMAPGLEVGGILSMQYVSDDVPGDHRSGKNYAVAYQAPAAKANDVLMGAPAAPAPAATFSPVQAQQTGNGWGQTVPAPSPYQPPVAPVAPPVPQAPAVAAPVAANDEQLAAFQAWSSSPAGQAALAAQQPASAGPSF